MANFNCNLWDNSDYIENIQNKALRGKVLGLRQKDYFGSIDSIEKAVNNHNELYILPLSFS